MRAAVLRLAVAAFVLVPPAVAQQDNGGLFASYSDGILDFRSDPGGEPFDCGLAADMRGAGLLAPDADSVRMGARTCDEIGLDWRSLQPAVPGQAAPAIRVLSVTETSAVAAKDHVAELLSRGATVNDFARTANGVTSYQLEMPDGSAFSRYLLYVETGANPLEQNWDQAWLELMLDPDGKTSHSNDIVRVELALTLPEIEGLLQAGLVAAPDAKANPDHVSHGEEFKSVLRYLKQNRHTLGCYPEHPGLLLHCFTSAAAILKIGEGNEETYIGTAVLIDAEHGLYLTAHHVAETHTGPFSVYGDTYEMGFVRVSVDTLSGDQPTSGPVRDIPIIRTTRTERRAIYEGGDWDILMFRVDGPVGETGWHDSVRILAPSAGEVPSRDRHGIQAVAAGYGQSNINGDGSEGTLRISRYQIGDCPDGGYACIGDNAYRIVMGPRPDDPRTVDDKSCQADSGSGLYVETRDAAGSFGAPNVVALVGILSDRMTPNSTLEKDGKIHCQNTLQFVDLTHPDIHDWIVEAAAELTGQSPAAVRRSYFTDGAVVEEPRSIVLPDRLARK